MSYKFKGLDPAVDCYRKCQKYCMENYKRDGYCIRWQNEYPKICICDPGPNESDKPKYVPFF